MATWIFGYGSLIWRPDLPHIHAKWGWIEGWERRFWQGSPDHRGTPEQPGRVLTLVPVTGAQCWGRAYCLDPAQEAETLAQLNHREKAGYVLHEVSVHCDEGPVRALTYVGGPDNPHFLGPAPFSEMLSQIRVCVGPSGSNRDYVLELAKALADQSDPSSDADLFRLAEALSQP